MGELKKVWARAGVIFGLTSEEADIVLACNGSSDDIAQIMRKVVKEGRFELNGDSYIPADCISQFNAEYGTDYDDTCEPEWDL